jgi:hypothetical protein
MLSTKSIRKYSHLAFAALLATAAACSDDDPVAPEEEPEVQTMTLTVGASTVTINATTGIPSGDLVVAAGANTVTATWKKADGTDETLVTSAEFDLRIVPTDNTKFSWTPTGAFGGTLTITGLAAASSTTAQVSLFHKAEQHDDFGPYTITVRRP